MQEKIFEMLMKEDEISWKTIIYDLVKTEQMDPWHIDLAVLSKKFIEVIHGMQEHDFKIPGKVLLAAAVLLKIKATHLIDNDISKLDQLINQTEEEYEDEFFDEIQGRTQREKQEYQLIPRNPQPRNRKVSIHDLVSALQRAMATKKKILDRQRPVKYTHHLGKKVDIMEVIRDIHHKIGYYSKKDGSNKVTFTRLLPPKAGKKEKVYTFLPLLHLENERKIVTEQNKHFDEIHISLNKKKKKTA